MFERGNSPGIRDTLSRLRRRLATLAEKKSDEVDFVLFRHAPVGDSLIQAMADAMRLVWTNEICRRTIMICSFYPVMARGSGGYNPTTNIFEFNMSHLSPAEEPHGGLVGLGRRARGNLIDSGTADGICCRSRNQAQSAILQRQENYSA